jgi:hypothetical protein
MVKWYVNCCPSQETHFSYRTWITSHFYGLHFIATWQCSFSKRLIKFGGIHNPFKALFYSSRCSYRLWKTTKILISIIGIQQRFIELCHPVTEKDRVILLRMANPEINANASHSTSQLAWPASFQITYEVLLRTRLRRSPLGGLSTLEGASDNVSKSSTGCWNVLDEPLCIESLDSCFEILTGVLGSEGAMDSKMKILIYH